MSEHIYTDEECIKDLTTLQEFYQITYGAEPVCLSHAIKRLEFLKDFVEIKVVGETSYDTKRNSN